MTHATITDPKRSVDRNRSDDATTLALHALVWTLAEPDRAERLLALTGLSPERLRAGLTDRGLQAAVIAFLAAHEADLVACAGAIGVTPEALAAAGEALAR